MDDLVEAFKNPGSACRGKPFWAWNGRLQEHELRRQIQVMHRMGLGGFFMHSRVGLATEYLSDEWFRMIRACIDEAAELGMEAWLYDEDRWPSGAAGGLVTRDPRYQHKNLRMVVCDPADVSREPEPLALFSACVEGHAASRVQRLGPDWDGKASPEGARVLAFSVVADEPSPWFNGETYLDTMSHEAVRRFIKVTHEAYRERVGEHFGALVPGIFTDEPNHGGLFGATPFQGADVWSVPWTPELPKHFQQLYGYDILDHLPHLFLEVDGQEVSRPRYHYHDCKTWLFVDAFARQVGEWCEQNGLLFTGHVLAEESLRSQASVVGSAMRFYEFMQAPGIDVLTERSQEYSTAKQCASVLHQTGRRWLLSELYGCTGWDFPFEGHKALGDWQAALGVNLRCQHLSWYTMAGEAKRDYPASIHFHSPWWEHYCKAEDYFGRVGAVMSRGKPVRRLLVIHSVESVWAGTTISWHEDKRIQQLEDEFDSLLHWLLDGHVDFDYGDEEMMSRLASIGDGHPPCFRVGEAAYAAVVVPPVDTLRASTLDLLEAFSKAGGTVVFCGEPPSHVDCEPAGRPSALARQCSSVPFERDAILEAVKNARTLSIADESGAEKAGVLYLLHEEDKELRLFMCNTDRGNPTGPLAVSVQAEGQVQLWDAETGERAAVQTERLEGMVRFRTSMPPSGSRLFVIMPKQEDLPALKQLREVRSVELPGETLSAELTEPNVLVLDMVEYRAGDGDWQGPVEILKADREIRKALGMPPRGGSMVQPWVRARDGGPEGHLELRYRFDVEQVPTARLLLATELPDEFEISLNGNRIVVDSERGWWVDPAIRTLPLGEASLLPGENVLLMSGTMNDLCQLEICYLLGDFAVKVSGTDACITGPLPPVGLGDWTKQGLPFYGGSVAFRTTIRPDRSDGERVFLEVPEFAGACARVLVDGEEAGVIGWRPHEVNVTSLLAGQAEVELAVEVIGHRRNCFGPLHHVEARPRWVGPQEFVTEADRWQDDYNLVPVGCMAPPRLSIRVES
ncbi:MAG: glycosyl hydrolase [Planctomycetota bacterium]